MTHFRLAVIEGAWHLEVVPRGWKKALLIAAGLTCSGCTLVQPHQRSTLARPDMTLGGDADLALGDEHAHDYREGAVGGGTIAAGGCGCG